MIEIWRTLTFDNIAPIYQISNTGYIKNSNELDKPIEIYHSSNGYDYIGLIIRNAIVFKNGVIQTKHFPLDELVAITFCKCPNELIGKLVKVRHIDGDTRNNNADNLIWVEDIEEWRNVNVPGYEDKYQVSNWGNVKTNDGYLLKPRMGNRQYLVVSFKNHGKLKSINVHRAVALTFYQNESINKVVNHIDENKCNNNIKNLEMITQRENNSFGVCKYLGADKLCMKVKCLETGVIYDSMKSASEQTGINYGNLSSCCSGKLHTAGGYRWAIAE